MHIIPIQFRAAVRLLAASALVCLTATGAGASKSIEGTVPQAASAMARQIDRQVSERMTRGDSLAVTVLVDVNDLDASNPLARQMAEELTRWIVQAGYNVQDIRKGRMVPIEPGNGVKLLTRRRNLLSRDSVESAAILTGTYSVTNKNVRFNIKIMHTGSLDVLGMATVSVPITSEVKSLLGSTNAAYARSFMGMCPSVGTMLP